MAQAPRIFDRHLLRQRRAPRPAARRRRPFCSIASRKIWPTDCPWCCASSISPPTSARPAMPSGERSLERKLAGRVVVAGPEVTPISASDLWRVIADEEALPFADQSLDLAVSALQLAFRERPSGNAGPDSSCAEARRSVSRRAARRRYADRIAPVLRRGGERNRRRRLAARGAVRRLARSRRVAAARGLRSAGRRQRPADRALSTLLSR